MKDIWDKISALSTLVTGGVVASIGIYATYTYNNRQLQVSEDQKAREVQISRVQTVEKFFPHLVDADERTTKGALIAISALGDEELATKLSEHFANQGGKAALQVLALSGSATAAAQASSALSRLSVIESIRAATVKIMVEEEPADGRAIRRVATGFLVSADGLVLTSSHLFADGSEEVAKPRPKIGVMREDGIFVRAIVRRKDDDAGLALVQLPKSYFSDSTSAVRFSEVLPEQGEEVIAVGYLRDDLGPSVFRGYISQVSAFEIGFTMPGGGSGLLGAPLANASGEIVGLVLGQYIDPATGVPSTLKAVPAEVAKHFVRL